jgi:hypothetical protein
MAHRLTGDTTPSATTTTGAPRDAWKFTECVNEVRYLGTIPLTGLAPRPRRAVSRSLGGASFVPPRLAPLVGVVFAPSPARTSRRCRWPCIRVLPARGSRSISRCPHPVGRTLHGCKPAIRDVQQWPPPMSRSCIIASLSGCGDRRAKSCRPASDVTPGFQRRQGKARRGSPLARRRRYRCICGTGRCCLFRLVAGSSRSGARFHWRLRIERGVGQGG